MSASPKPIFNPFLPAYRDDPHPFLHQLRTHDPVHFSSIMSVWILTRHADCLAALHDPSFSADARHWTHYEKFFFREKLGSVSPPADAYRKWLLQMDPPDHTRLRSLVAKAFAPRLIEALRPRITQIINDLLDGLPSTGKFDLISDIAYPLPIAVISAMLGVPPEDDAKIRLWSAGLLPSFSPGLSLAAARQVNQTMADFQAYFRALADQRRRAPQPDLLSALLAVRDATDKLSDDELISTCILLVFAGHASFVQWLGSAVLTLLAHPDQLAALRADRTRLAPALEEVLRHASPLQLVYRTTIAPATIGSVTIPANQMVLVSLAAANRDPAQFPDPDRFDIHRDPRTHLAFGHGSHFCIGAPLARLEATIALDAILTRLPNLHLAGPLRRESSMLLRGLESVPLCTAH